MNREQKRAEAKKLSKEGMQRLDISVDRPIVPDGFQFRIPATAMIEGKKQTLCLVTVCVPLIYCEADSDKPGFIMDFGAIAKKVIGADFKECLIMDIVTAPNLRRLGIGAVVVDALKHYFSKMITGARTKEGLSLMKRCGFEEKNGQLVWIKGDGKEKE